MVNLKEPAHYSSLLGLQSSIVTVPSLGYLGSTVDNTYGQRYVCIMIAKEFNCIIHVYSCAHSCVPICICAHMPLYPQTDMTMDGKIL